MRVAAIDVGSNSIRLLVCEVTPGADGAVALKAVARSGEPCRLARGLGATGLIEPALSARAATLARGFRERAMSLGARRILIGATAALREATNGREVADEIAREAGVPVRILTGDEEARLIYQSVVTGFGGSALRSACVVFDLGGGSTEVVSGFGSKPGRWTSLPLGAVTLTERFLSSGPPTRDEIQALTEWVQSRIMHDCALLPERAGILAGVGGTVTVLALLDRGLTHYDPALIEGWAIESTRLEALARRCVSASISERRSWPALGEGRVDIVGAGALVVQLLAERFPSPALLCSTQGLRYGLARLAAEELWAEGGEESESERLG